MDSEVKDGWQVEVVRSEKMFNITIPAVLTLRHYDGSPSFFSYEYAPGHGSKSGAFDVHFDRDDPKFRSFVAKFYEQGHLCLEIGPYLHFGSLDSSINLIGYNWARKNTRSKTNLRLDAQDNQGTSKSGFVYLIRLQKTQIYKIGKADDPERRLSGFQTANPFELNLLYSFKADNVFVAERELHRVLDHIRMGGEWFKLLPKQREKIISISRFENGSFWIDGQAVKADDLF